jgi:hypothetical protein
MIGKNLKMINDAMIAKMVDSFLAWPLPKSVHPDECVMNPDYPSELSGTHLLTATEAENMIRFILGSVDVTSNTASSDTTIQTETTSVIYSRSEEWFTGFGYWNLTEGWTSKDKANHFADTVFPPDFNIPKSVGRDTMLVPSNFKSSFNQE